jgi:hypothetical protein
MSFDDAIDLVAVFLIVYIALKTWQDAHRTRHWLQWATLMSFTWMAWLLCEAIKRDNSWLSQRELVDSGIVALGINAIVIYLRQEPPKRDATVMDFPAARAAVRKAALLHRDKAV